MFTMLNKLLTIKSSSSSSSSQTSSSSSSLLSTKMNWKKDGQFGLFVWIFVFVAVATYYHSSLSAEAYPVNLMMTRKYPVNVEVENPEELISTLDNLIQNILVGIDSSHSNNMQQITDKSSGTNKRGIDLGLSRGFSGSQAAKHLMGMSAASFANGPGRKR
ncbi:diuretic hormone class 2 [Dermatophagoides farinae]|uniref:diuretic hormone class 2 n=1 Tax=Dermatophagoides farinae TaxID=6954 RepID=UPI001F0DA1AC|nr:diuretic hormone class 2-like [Dermatophagoides farinae]